MATTSSIDLPSSHPLPTTPLPFAGVAIGWIVYGAAMTRWALRHGRIELRAIHLIPICFGFLVLTGAVVALALAVIA